MKKKIIQEITVIGLWHQGIVAAACLAELGFKVTAADLDAKKINNLSNGMPPIFEPGLEELIKKGLKNERLKFVSDLSSAVKGKEFVFLMFDTKVDNNDITDLKDIFESIDKFSKSLNDDCIIYNTSQVPVGTNEELEKKILEKNPEITFSIVYSPENLRLGQAIKLYLQPALPVLGSNDDRALARLESFLQPFNVKWLKVNLRTAEVLKHALNSYLATTISFANELGNICDEIGADGFEIAKALRLEPRIGAKAMLRPGMGFSGGTLARDVQTLRKIGNLKGINTFLLDGLWETNNYQNKFVIRKLEQIYGDLIDIKITILGITYKPGTSTLRRSVALETIKSLISLGAKISVHDPKADEEEIKEIKEIMTLDFHKNVNEAIDRTDAIAVMTAWDDYLEIDWKSFKSKVSNPVLIDCNNLYDHKELTSLGYKYFCIGRGLKSI
tara:strand:+ start:2022 stop:3353 length:1332 start_codon:yes stop_codon:yes gene_type:complete